MTVRIRKESTIVNFTMLSSLVSLKSTQTPGQCLARKGKGSHWPKWVHTPSGCLLYNDSNRLTESRSIPNCASRLIVCSRGSTATLPRGRRSRGRSPPPRCHSTVCKPALGMSYPPPTPPGPPNTPPPLPPTPPGPFYQLFWLGGQAPTRIDYTPKKTSTLILTSLLEDLAKIPSQKHTGVAFQRLPFPERAVEIRWHGGILTHRLPALPALHPSPASVEIRLSHSSSARREPKASSCRPKSYEASHATTR